MGDKDQEEFSEHYKFILTPKNSPIEAKTGVTFRGSSPEYKKAHQAIIDLLKKGDTYVFNGVEITVKDVTSTKPARIGESQSQGCLVRLT